MKKVLLIGALTAGLSAYSQTTIFQDDFESGAVNWTLNSTDLSGSTAANYWLVNNVYTGGTGSLVCMGFPFSFNIGATAAQPAGISSANGNYMHVSSLAGTTSGINNANFVAADGVCTLEESNFTKMASAVSTIGFSGVELSFWQLIGGEAGAVVGEVYYSLDNGTTWILKTGNINTVTTWTNQTLTDAAWDNVSSLKFAFRFVNGEGSAPVDPSFALDDIRISGTASAIVSLTTGSITNTTYCYYESHNVTVPFTVTGTVNSGNVYTAQLSSATGSFATPATIGTLTSTANGSLSISGTIPSGLPIGTQYRIRVVSSDPAVIGTDNGTNLSVLDRPNVSITANPANGTVCDGEAAVLTANGASFFLWSPGASLDNTTTQTVNATPTQTTTYSLVGTDTHGCFRVVNFTVTVDDCLGLGEDSFGDFELYPNPVAQELNVNFGELKGLQSVSISDLSGRIVFSNLSTSNAIDVSSLESGKYFLMIEHAAGVSVKAFVKQ